jgi:hypothetical protein
MTMAESPAAAPAEPVSSEKATIAKLSAQLKKVNEANGKYKNLLKLAKERIQQGEEELAAVRLEKSAFEDRLITDEKEAARQILQDEANDRASVDLSIVRVLRRLKVQTSSGLDEIWALLEMEVVPNDLMLDTSQAPRRFKEWKRFDTESELKDFIRRDTGEPLTLPPYSLSPDQSAQIQVETVREISKVTEEFRRFRVRSELARKQADAHICDLQSKNMQTVARRIEGADKQLDQRMASGALERIRAEMASQDAHWKEAYDILLAENKALKSSGSEAMLAAQWRQRYEATLKENEDLLTRLSLKTDLIDQSKYEAKYRDLRESFRLYRKKAKEIFAAQQNGADPTAIAFNVSNSSSADAKLSYLKNLMVNYFSSEQAVQDHMQSAIGTVLQFSRDDLERIEKRKVANEAWF